MTPIIELELFDVWGVEFMGTFLISLGMKEGVDLPNNVGRSAITFLNKYIFSWFGTPLQSLVMVGHISIISYLRVFLRSME